MDDIKNVQSRSPFSKGGGFRLREMGRRLTRLQRPPCFSLWRYSNWRCSRVNHIITKQKRHGLLVGESSPTIWGDWGAGQERSATSSGFHFFYQESFFAQSTDCILPSTIVSPLLHLHCHGYPQANRGWRRARRWTHQAMPRAGGWVSRRTCGLSCREDLSWDFVNWWIGQAKCDIEPNDMNIFVATMSL